MRKFFWIPILVAIAAYLLMPMPGTSKPLAQKIQDKRNQIGQKKHREGVLTTTISGFNTRIDGLQGQINGTQTRLRGVQGQLDSERRELQVVRDQLEGARDRLARARAKLRVARSALSDRLVELYKSDQPDVLTVVLQSDGFDDLLNRTDFLERISDRDRSIVSAVRIYKARATREEKRLSNLEGRKKVAADAILSRRNDIAASRNRLVSAQGELRGVRDRRRTALASVRGSRQDLEGNLKDLEAAQAKVTAQLSGTSTGGPIKHGSGNLIWPVNGPIVSPFGMRWGRLHAGIDIAVPEGTPVHAADSGTVVLMGVVSGYGNYTCVQHTGSLSTCYAHQSRFATSQGASVKQGQVIGYSGCTGHCLGPHVHFETRVNGTPQDPMGYL